MHVRHYGIFVAYPPTVDLRDQGLGRHLAMFLKGAEPIDDIKFTILCPSWTKDALESLFESEQVSASIFDVVAPSRKPYALRLYELFRAYRARPKRPSLVARFVGAAVGSGKKIVDTVSARGVAVYNVWSLILFVLYVVPLAVVFLPFAVILSPLILLVSVVGRLSFLWKYIGSRIAKNKWVTVFRRYSSLMEKPEAHAWVLDLFDKMQEEELRRMWSKLKAVEDIRAWYCPTAFWPAFHKIKAPRLMCVPDVVLCDFPVGFSGVGGDRFLRTFEAVETAIRGGEYFVTYSETVKWNTLVDRYNVPADNVAVIQHATNSLDALVNIHGFENGDVPSRNFCQGLLVDALRKSGNYAYAANFSNSNVKFLFYASQLRPNKNVLLLLRAYEHLLRKRYLGHKLLLTGSPAAMPEIWRFVVENRLEGDVLFLHGLSISELAACYKLADIAVNPTLSEGGCPFTFTEALSVGTPVVMSRIPVAQEILSDEKLSRLTFFDPYSWKDCANRIEWAVHNRQELLEVQKVAYQALSGRTWSDVVREHVDVMEKIAVRAQSRL